MSGSINKPTLADVVNGTPKGRAAVNQAIEESIKDQNEMIRKAKGKVMKIKTYSTTCYKLQIGKLKITVPKWVSTRFL